MADATLRVKNLREFLRASDHAGAESKSLTRRTLSRAGEVVRADWAGSFSQIDKRSAAHLRVKVVQRGVFVEQGLRKTTGLHPEYGALQMRFGLRALARVQPEIESELERDIDVIADHFDQG